MIIAPLAFLEVKGIELFNAVEFGNAALGKTPKGFEKLKMSAQNIRKSFDKLRMISPSILPTGR